MGQAAPGEGRSAQMLKAGQFIDPAMERDFRLSVMAREVRSLRINLAGLMLLRLLPIILDFYYMPADTVLSVYLPARLALYPVIVAVMLIPVRPATYVWRHGAILLLLSAMWMMTAMTFVWGAPSASGLTASLFVAVLCLMNYLFLPTRWLWMVAWGVAASLGHVLFLLPQTGVTPLQNQICIALLALVNIFGALTSHQIASLHRLDFLRLRQLEQANGELRQREAVIADQRDELSGQVARLEEAHQRLLETQAHLIQSEKLAGLGGLVAGVAHELNTPIGIAFTAVTHLQDGVEEMDKAILSGRLTRSQMADYQQTLHDTARLIQTNIGRAAELVQSFKQVSVDQASAERRAFLLGDYIGEVLQSLAPRLRDEPHRIQVTCPPGLSMDTYPGALAQIITNLVLNAVIHAFAPGQAGHIDIQVRELPGDRVELTFADDGQGVAPDHLDRLFEPFFTTKRGRGGSGLGLNIVHRLVVQTMGGSISVVSQPCQGTRFILALPRHPGAPDATGTPPAALQAV